MLLPSKRTLIARLEVKDWSLQRDAAGVDSPVSEEERTWRALDFLAVYPWAAFSIATWTAGSALLSLGLTIGQAMGAATVAYTVIVISSIAAGYAGSRWRLSDPLLSRLAWGIRGYYFTLFWQIVVDTCFYSVQLVFGYLSLKVVIGAMAPSFLTMHNSFSDNLPTNDFICMIIFLIICVALQALPPTEWHTLGRVGASLTLVTFVTIVSVCCAKAGGVGPLVREPFGSYRLSQKPRRAEAVWGFFLATSTILAFNSMLQLPNYTRYAKTHSAPIPGAIIGIGILPLLVTFFGILTTSAAIEVFPEEERLLWAPYEILLAFQLHGSKAVRAATFFGGLVLVIPQIGMNVTGNAYCTGVSYSTLFPRWFTVRRGGYVTTALAVAINPWNFAGKPTSFGRFLNGISILYGCLSGIFLVDYFIVRKQKVSISHLVGHEGGSIYSYTRGVNWRAIAAFFLAAWLPAPGWIMIMQREQSLLTGAWQKLYGLSWPLTCVAAGLAYYLLCRVWPIPIEGVAAHKSEDLSNEGQSI